MVLTKIEQLLGQVEPKLLTQVQNYLEYLIFVQQQKRKPRAATKNIQEQSNTLSALQRFKGDAPFPHTPVSKSDIYEQ